MHLIHRGVNRTAVFLDADDFETYRGMLHACLRAENIALHAYVLMTNHVHLLVTGEATGAVSRAMSKLGQRYVPRFNRRHGRTGTLWEGRFRSCLVETEHYLLRVYRYIERNPVRAAMADAPEDYRWSSVHANLRLLRDPLVSPHPVFSAFAGNDGLCPKAYRQWLHEGCSPIELQTVRLHLQQERALGNAGFQAMVAGILERPVACRPRGRPARSDALDAA